MGRNSGSGGGAGGRTRPITEVGGAKYTPSPAAAAHGDATVLVDVNKLDQAWSREQAAGFYIPRGGGGAEIGGRRRNFEAFQQTGRPIEQPQVNLNRDGSVAFVDGRHRFSVLRDQGVQKIPVSVPRSQAARVRRELG